MVPADDVAAVDCRKLHVVRQPPPRHAHVAQGIDVGVAIEQVEEPQGVVAGIGDQRHAVDAVERLPIRTARGEGIAPHGGRDKHEVRRRRPIEPGLQVGAARLLGGNEILQALERDQGAVAVTDDRHRPQGIDLTEEPCHVTALGKRPLVFCPAVLQKEPLLLARPGENHRSHPTRPRAGCRTVPSHEQPLLLGRRRIITVAVNEDDERLPTFAAVVAKQPRQIGPLPATAATAPLGSLSDKLFDAEIWRQRHSAGVRQAAGAHAPDVGLGGFRHTLVRHRIDRAQCS